jgi:hypothetical protein
MTSVVQFSEHVFEYFDRVLHVLGALGLEQPEPLNFCVTLRSADVAAEKLAARRRPLPRFELRDEGAHTRALVIGPSGSGSPATRPTATVAPVTAPQVRAVGAGPKLFYGMFTLANGSPGWSS